MCPRAGVCVIEERGERREAKAKKAKAATPSPAAEEPKPAKKRAKVVTF